MQVIKSFDPTIAKEGTIDISAPEAGSKILLYNLSIVTIQIDFDNGSTALLHPGEANYWTLDGLTPQLEWSQYSILNSVQSPISQVTGTLYGRDEKIEGNYPTSLIYQINVGNPLGVNTNVSGASSLANDGNTAGTQFIEATPVGDASSAVSVKNDGTFVLGNPTHHGSISIDNAKIFSDGNGNL